jgi:hypothetical protein
MHGVSCPHPTAYITRVRGRRGPEPCWRYAPAYAEGGGGEGNLEQIGSDCHQAQAAESQAEAQKVTAMTVHLRGVFPLNESNQF